MFLKGFAFRIRGDISINAINALRKEGAKLMGSLNNKKLNEKNKNSAMMILAIKAFHMKIKFQPGESSQFLAAFLDNTGGLAPNSIDLVDIIGAMLSQSSFMTSYDNMPFFQQTIDIFHEVAQCNIEFGISNHLFTSSLNFKTEGIDLLFDLIMKGMSV